MKQEELAKSLLTTPRCDRCQWWQRYHGEVNGRCRACPPTPFANGTSKLPDTRESDFCSLFKALPIGVDPVVKEKHQVASPVTARREREDDRRNREQRNR